MRQSSPYQVLNNRESQKLQYAMEARLRWLGWHEVEIIDEDLGRSAGGSITRTGFERMIAQVCLGEVGAVCAREVSRFARNTLRCNHEIPCHEAQRQMAEGWINFSQAARLAGITNRTLRLAIERGEITAERPMAGGPWVLKKSITERERSMLSRTGATGQRSPRGIISRASHSRLINQGVSWTQSNTVEASTRMDRLASHLTTSA